MFRKRTLFKVHLTLNIFIPLNECAYFLEYFSTIDFWFGEILDFLWPLECDDILIQYRAIGNLGRAWAVTDCDVNLGTANKENKASSSRKCVTLRRATWLYPCPLELGGEPNTAPFWRDFWNFSRTQKEENLTKSIIFFRRTTAWMKIFQLRE